MILVYKDEFTRVVNLEIVWVYHYQKLQQEMYLICTCLRGKQHVILLQHWYLIMRKSKISSSFLHTKRRNVSYSI